MPDDKKGNFINRITQDITFKGGMNKSLAKGYIGEDNYIHAENLRLISRNEGETIDLVNVDGNKFTSNVPSIITFYETGRSYPDTDSIVVSIVVNAQTITLTKASATYANKLDFYTAITALINTDASTYLLRARLQHIKNSTDDFYRIDCYSSKGYQLTSLSYTPTGATKNYLYVRNLKICGYTNLRSSIILFTTEEYTEGSTVKYSQCWKLDFDDTLINSDYPIPSWRLVYNNDFGLSLYYPVEAKPDYETDELGKVFFTDDHGYPKMINTLIDNAELQSQQLNFVNEVIFSRIKIDSITDGGYYLCGSVSYCYQYFRKNGQLTTTSPITNPLHLAFSGEHGGSSDKYRGGIATEESQKSVSLHIDDLDERFEYVQLISIYYSDKTSVPKITIIKQQGIPSNGTAYFTDNGRNFIDNYTLTDLLTFGQVLFKCKYLEVKDKRLFPKGITYEYFDIDFDARAYRFKDDSVLGLYSRVYDGADDSDNSAFIYGNGDVDLVVDGTPFPPTLTDWALPEDYDAILVKDNQRFYGGDVTNSIGREFCFLKDGSQFGGSGKNVEYKFFLTQLKEDINTDNRNFKLFPTDTQNWNNILGETIYDTNVGFGNYKSAINNKQIVGFQRDEVYRVGINLIDTYGRRSFTNWIGNIRFPSISDRDGVVTYTDGYTNYHDFSLSYVDTNDNCVYLNILGLEVSVDLTDSIYDNIVGYEIVYVKREEKDRTVIAQGVMERAEVWNYDGTGTVHTKYAARTCFTLINQNDNSWYYFDSPEVSFNNSFTISTNTKINLVGALSLEASLYTVDTISDIGSDSAYKNILIKCRRVVPTLDGGEIYDRRIDMESGEILSPGEYKNIVLREIGGYFIDGNLGNDNISTHLSRKGTSFAFKTEDELIITGIPSEASNKNYAVTTDIMFINLDIDVNTQYGGYSYEERKNNIYQSTGCFIEREDTPSFRKILGGDTFISMWDHLMAMSRMYTSGSIYSGCFDTIVYYFPVESMYNISLQHGSDYNRVVGNSIPTDNPAVPIIQETVALGVEEFGVNYPESLTDYYQLNEVYNRQNDIYIFLPKPLFFQDTITYDDRILASNVKTSNELIDNWTIYPSLNYKDIESEFGAITGSKFWKNKIFVFQPHAICVPSVNDRSVVTSTTGEDVSLGSTGLLDRVDYLTTDYGTVHPKSIVPGQKGLYFYDYPSNSICVITDTITNLSDKLGIKPYLDENIKGLIKEYERTFVYKYGSSYYSGLTVYGVYDPQFKEIIFTFNNLIYEDGSLNRSYFTLVFNEELMVFNGFYSMDTPMYIQGWNKVLSIKRDAVTDNEPDELYINNLGDKSNFFGTEYDSILHLMVNKNIKFTKVFDNLWLVFGSKNSSGYSQHIDFFKWIRVYNDYQNTGILTFKEKATITTTKTNSEVFFERRERTWFVAIPKNAVKSTLATMDSNNILAVGNLDMTKTFKERLRDKYVVIELTYDNSTNNSIDISLVSCDMRLSFR